MKIRFNKKQMKVVEKLYEEPFNFSRTNSKWEAVIEINLKQYTKDELLTLKKEVDLHLHVFGMKSISADIKMWIEVNEEMGTAKQTRMTSVKNAEAIFYARMVNLERKHLYR